MTAPIRVFVVTDDSARVLGHVGDALIERGAVLEGLEREDLPSFASLDEPGLVMLMGSHLTAHDPGNRTVPRESALVVDALASGVPVLGICYGSQLMARALGGDSRHGARTEIGWHAVDSLDPILCPPGPWAQAHKDVFVAPPTARLLGTSSFGHQAFLDETHGAPALAWQFHPEVTTEEFIRWLDDEPDYYVSQGADLEAIQAETRARAATNRAAAFALVDAALAALGLTTR